MPTAKELAKKLYDDLGRSLAHLGFVFDPRALHYTRVFDKGWQSVSLNIARFHAELHVAVDVAIRFEELQQLIGDLREDLDEEIKPLMASLGCELGSLHQGIRRVWHVRTVRDSASVAGEMLALIEEAGLPFLEKYSSLDVAEDAFARDDKEAERVQVLMHVRAENAVGLAFLRGDRRRFEELVSRKTEVLERANDFGKREFLGIVEKLRERFPAM